MPHMDHFYDNSLQTGLMRDLAIDMELLGEHLVLLGNQGVGKNKIVDRYVRLPCVGSTWISIRYSIQVMPATWSAERVYPTSS